MPLDIEFTPNAETVLRHRYLRKNKHGEVVETPEAMFRRVARTVAEGEPDAGEREAAAERFFHALARLDFLPNSPTLMNAGTALGQMSACFVLPVPDSIEGIFNAVKHMAIIHQSGGGTGFSFSNIRPRDDLVASTGGSASGPVSFMRVFDMATDVVRQGGRRRGANMGILRADHPDIRDFIAVKTEGRAFRNFNLSVAAPDRFMRAVRGGGTVQLINPRTHEPTEETDAAELFDLIADAAWRCGDPGLVFIDRVNDAHPLPHPGRIESTNPCGEQPLLPYESCVLGSVNLVRMLRGDRIDWAKLRETVRLGVRFLDDVIDAQTYPLAEIERMTRRTRKIGLGLMGFADMLIRMGIPYASDDALRTAEDVMRTITETGTAASVELAEARGPFPAFEGSRWDEAGRDPLRNATVTTIAPTGTISIIAGVSSGIEPVFALSYFRRVLDGQTLLEEHPIFVEAAKKHGCYSRELIADIARRGSVQGLDSVPDELQRLFACALDIDPARHVRMQAAFQKHTHNAVSKTINLPEKATVDHVKQAYLDACELGCKGITVYRYGCKKEQTLSFPAGEEQVQEGEPAGPAPEASLQLGAEETGACRQCAT
jgi:ribonucleoside-diphosphate reductase alpha chain